MEEYEEVVFHFIDSSDIWYKVDLCMQVLFRSVIGDYGVLCVV